MEETREEELSRLMAEVSRLVQRMSEIQAYELFMDDSAGMVTVWTLLSEYETSDLMAEDKSMTFRFSPSGQSRSATAGLIHINDVD